MTETTLPVKLADTLQVVHGTDALTAYTFAENDRVLRQRDLVLAWLYDEAMLAFLARYGCAGNKIAVNEYGLARPAAGVDTGQYVTGTASDTIVHHVGYSSLPIAAYDTDLDLYGRDVSLYQYLLMLCQTAQVPVLNAATVSDYVPTTKLAPWDNAMAQFNAYAEPHANRMLTPELFSDADRSLAYTDNILYQHLLAWQRIIAMPYQHYNTFISVGTQYVLAKITARYRYYYGVSHHDVVTHDLATGQTRHNGTVVSSQPTPVTLANKRQMLASAVSQCVTSTRSVSAAIPVSVTTSQTQTLLTVTGNSNSRMSVLAAITKSLVIEPLSSQQGINTLSATATQLSWTVSLTPNRAYNVKFEYTGSNAVTFPVVISMGSVSISTLLLTGDQSYTLATPVLTQTDNVLRLTYTGTGTVLIRSVTLQSTATDTEEDCVFILYAGTQEVQRLCLTAAVEHAFVLTFTGLSAGQYRLVNNSQLFLQLFSYQESTGTDTVLDQSLGLSQAWMQQQRLYYATLTNSATTGGTSAEYTTWAAASFGSDGLNRVGPAGIGQPVLLPVGSSVSDGTLVSATSASTAAAQVVSATPDLIKFGAYALPPQFWL